LSTTELLCIGVPNDKKTRKRSFRNLKNFSIWRWGGCHACPCLLHRVQKKDATDFLLQLLQILTDFHNFSCTTSQDNAKVIGVRIYHHTLVMLLTYRVKVSDTKVTHFTPILALCTCLYRSHLWKLVSMKQTKHNRNS